MAIQPSHLRFNKFSWLASHHTPKQQFLWAIQPPMFNLLTFSSFPSSRAILPQFEGLPVLPQFDGFAASVFLLLFFFLPSSLVVLLPTSCTSFSSPRLPSSPTMPSCFLPSCFPLLMAFSIFSWQACTSVQGRAQDFQFILAASFAFHIQLCLLQGTFILAKFCLELPAAS